MEKFIHQHEYEHNYEDYVMSSEYKEPYVSYTFETDLVRYNVIKNKPFTLNILSGGNIIFKSSNNSYSKTIYYSINGNSWVSVTPSVSGVSVTVHNGDKIYIKSLNTSLSDGTNYIYINNSLGCTFTISGNIFSLIFDDDYLEEDITITSSYTFKNLFYNCTGLTRVNTEITIPEYLTIGMWEGTFKNCINLINTIELYMENIPNYAYKETFSGCSSLTEITGNNLLVDSIGEHSCEEMFAGCSSLIALKTFILNDCAPYCCKGMFKNCTSLSIANPKIKYSINNISRTSYTNLGKFHYTGKGFYYGSYVTSLNGIVGQGVDTSNNFTGNWTCYSGTIMTYNFDFSSIPEQAIIKKIYARVKGYVYYDTIKASLVLDNDKISSEVSLTRCPSNTPQIMTINATYLPTLDELDEKQLKLQLTWSNPGASISGGTCYIEYEIPTEQIYQFTSSFEEMFYGCISLNYVNNDMLALAPISNSCFKNMFAHSGLVNSPGLYSKILAESCYESMFEECSSLIKAPDLNSETLVTNCYKRMFYNCSSLNLLNCKATTILSNEYTNNWLIGVQEVGTYIKHRNVQVSSIPKNTNGIIYGVPERWLFEDFSGNELKNMPLSFKALSSGEINIRSNSYNSSSDYNYKFNYIKNGGEPVELIVTGTGNSSTRTFTIPVSANDEVQLYIAEDNNYNLGGASSDSTNYYGISISSTARIKLYGNLISLATTSYSSAKEISKTFRHLFYGWTNLISIDNLYLGKASNDYIYYNLFGNCTGLTSIPSGIFKSMKLSTGCYYKMFSGCIGLTSLPNDLLPSVNLSSYCYGYMFQNCKGLTSLPSNLLPAATVENGSYSNMFYGCTGLTSLPNNLLPAINLGSDCYEYMFYGCTGLTSLPNNLLPATNLANYCYEYMFQNCTGLTSLPNNLLPAATLADYCYRNMFYGCAGLTSLPNNLLPATTLADYCYQYMFYGCTGLTTLLGGLLPAITLANNCYQYMFYGCTGLTSLSNGLLPATTLANYCYNDMFYGCTGLTSLPSGLLPAITLSNYCYQAMFCNCTGLISVPTNLLPAINLAENAYSSMFNGCSNLENGPELLYNGILPSNVYSSMFNGCLKINYIKSLATDISATNCINNWLNNVAETGTLVHHSQAVYQRNSPSGIPTGWNEVLVGIGSSRDLIYFENVSESKQLTVISSSAWRIIDASSNLIFSQNNGVAGTTEINVSTNNINIRESSFTLINNDNNSKIIRVLSFDCSNYENEPLRFNILSDGSFNCNWYKSNVGDMTQFNLIYKINSEEWVETNLNNNENITINVNKGDVVYFKGNNEYVHSSTTTSLGYGFYFNNFNCNFTASGNIKSLFTTDYLNNNSITLHNYDLSSLFYNNKYIYSAKYLYLPFINLSNSIYRNMFYSCTNLEYGAILEDNLIMDTYSCSYMYYNCSNLIELTKLIVSQANTSCCENMFYNCSNLISINNFQLNALTLYNSCYQQMFTGCSKFILPNNFTLPATTLAPSCYNEMFNNCKALISLPTGFRLPATQMSPSCYYRMFYRCSNLTSLPTGFTLPATTLADSCYYEMFRDCIGLTSLPTGFTLPATQLEAYCYRSMFYECTGLTSLPTSFTISATSTANSCCSEMFYGCTNLGLLPSGFTLLSESLSSSCYYRMFKNCEKLQVQSTFVIAATQLNSSCCEEMFYNCKLLTLPEGFTLFAENSASYCYERMFAECSNLEKAPIINMVNANSSYCCREMFINCTKLNYIKCLVENPRTGSYSFNNWVSNVSPTGLFIKSNGAFINEWIIDSVSGIPIGWSAFKDGELIEIIGKNVILVDNDASEYNTTIRSAINFTISTSDTWLHISTLADENNPLNTMLTVNIDANTPNGSRTGIITISGEGYSKTITINQHEIEEEELTFEFLSNGTLWWVKNNNNISKDIEYSKNGGAWTTITPATNSSSTSSSYTNFISVSNRDVLKFRGNNTTYGTNNTNNYLRFVCNANFKASGNIMSLISSTGFNSIENLSDDYTFRKLFYGCSQLKDISGLRLTAKTLTTGAYQEMFYGCTGLTSIPENLFSPVTTLGQTCFGDMFNGCTNLLTIPSNLLPITTLANNCYGGMFNGCTKLNIPSNFELPAAVLTNQCYQYMFQNTAIDSIPSNIFRNVTTLANSCYKYMFAGTKITSIPNNLLSVTDVVEACYYGMFKSCTLLTSIPSTLLPSNKTAKTGYMEMFSGCSAITSIPNTLFSNINTTYAQDCFKYMFEGTGITSIPEDLIPNYTLGTGSLVGMFKGCTQLEALPTNLLKQTGTAPAYVFQEMFMNCTSITEIPNNFMKYTAFNNTGYCYAKMFDGCTSLITVPDNLLSVTALKGHCYDEMFRRCSSLIKTVVFGATTLAGYCYSYMYADCTSLTTIQSQVITSSMATFDHCFYGMFYNCISLVNLPNNFNLTGSNVTTYCYDNMFNGCKNLVNGPLLAISSTANYCCEHMFDGCEKMILPEGFILNGKSLAQYCYSYMFNNCKALTLPNSFIINNLEAVNNYCCQYMFSGCTSLNNISNLNLTVHSLSNYCYQYMFTGCIGLTSLPNNLIQCGIDEGDTLNSSAYSYMFQNCTGLTSLPSGLLPATTLVSYCYSHMFEGCSGLTSLPSGLLPATTLADYCYSNMFEGCSGLTSLPSGLLSATTLANYCYQYMFYRCTGLTTLPSGLLPATTLSNYCYTYMFYGCTGLNTLPSNLLPATTLANYCYRYMFYECTGLILLPSNLLPATTLASYCYAQMFYGCTNLINAPDLLVESVTNSAYYYMFYNCNKLKYVKCLAITRSCSNWLGNVSSDGIFIKNINSNDWPSGISGIPNNWTVYNDGAEPNNILLYGISPKKNYYLDNEINSLTVSVNANAPLTFTLSNNWFTLNTNHEFKDNIHYYTLTINTPVNNSNEAKELNININNGGNTIDSIYVYQTNLTKNYVLDLHDTSWIEDQSINGYKTNTILLGESKSITINIIGYEEFSIEVYSGYKFGTDYAYYNYLYVGKLDNSNPTRDYVWNGYYQNSNKWTTIKFDNITTDVVHTITIVYVRSPYSYTENTVPDNNFYGYLRISNQ